MRICTWSFESGILQNMLNKMYSRSKPNIQLDIVSKFYRKRNMTLSNWPHRSLLANTERNLNTPSNWSLLSRTGYIPHCMASKFLLI